MKYEIKIGDTCMNPRCLGQLIERTESGWVDYETKQPVDRDPFPNGTGMIIDGYEPDNDTSEDTDAHGQEFDSLGYEIEDYSGYPWWRNYYEENIEWWMPQSHGNNGSVALYSLSDEKVFIGENFVYFLHSPQQTNMPRTLWAKFSWRLDLGIGRNEMGEDSSDG